MHNKLIQLKYPYILPELPYAYEALEPYIDTQTMQIHHTKHHGGYVNKLNNVLEKYPSVQNMPLIELLKQLEALDIPEEDKELIRNNGGGHINHTIFWNTMGPEKEVDDRLIAEITESYGSLDEFKSQFSKVALSHFGSGWVWLVRNRDGQLEIYSLLNQDSPYLLGDIPLIGLDVWEHAYYLKYQNRRAEYIENWWNVFKFF